MGSWKAVNYKMPCLDPPFHMTRKYFFGGQAAWKNEFITSVALDARHCQSWKVLTYILLPCPTGLYDVLRQIAFGELSAECFQKTEHTYASYDRNAQIIKTYGEIRERRPEQMWGMICKIRENEWMVDGNGWLVDLTSSDKTQFVSEVKKRECYRDSKELQYLATVFVLG